MSVKYISALGVLLLSFVLLVGAAGASIASYAGLPASSNSCPNVESSLYFTIVYGSVTIDGAPAPTGTVVEARNPRGDTVGCGIAQDGSYGTFYVYGEDTTVIPSIPGMRKGETITFYVDGQRATASPSLAWVNDHQVHLVDLEVSDLLTTPTVVPTSPPSLTCPDVQNSLRLTVVYGDVSISNSLAPAGTIVEARNPRDDTVGCFTVTEVGSYGTLYVYGEDTAVTPSIPGMRIGETVAFFINGEEATALPTLVWANDREFHEVDLNVEGDTSTPTPTATPDPETEECIYLPLVIRNG
jgi:hypothetical protein